MDSTGIVYVADTDNHRIRKVTSAGVVTTLAGSGTSGFANGTGTTAQFNQPNGIAVDNTGTLYVADTYNHRIRKMTSAGVVTTLAGSGSAGSADGTGAAASFDYPAAIAVDSAGTVYVAQHGTYRIRKITSAGVVTTLAGSGSTGSSDGTGGGAGFNAPSGIAVDSTGTVYVTDGGNHRIRKITSAGVVTTLAGSDRGYNDGTGSAARFNDPRGIALDKEGNIYVAEQEGNIIRKITSSGVVTTLAGTGKQARDDGRSAATAQFNFPYGVAVDSLGNVYVADRQNDTIRVIIPPPKAVSTLAGSNGGFANGTGTAAMFNEPFGMAVSGSGTLFVADRSNHRIRQITTNGVVTTFAGSGTVGFTNATGIAAQFSSPWDVALDTSGNLYVSDYGNHRIRKVTSAGVVTTLAGSGTAGNANGTGTNAQFKLPTSLAVDSAGNVFVADSENHAVRKITAAGAVTTLAGSGREGFADGTGTNAIFAFPSGLTLDGAGNVYVSDNVNRRVRKITAEGVVTTFAGSGVQGFADGKGAAAQFSIPAGLVFDAAGNLYVADTGNERVRRITPEGEVTTLAGSGVSGSADGSVETATFLFPRELAFDIGRRLLYVSSSDHKIRQIDLKYSAPALTLASLPSGTRRLYQRGDDTIVGSFPIGQGKVTYIGAEWSNMQPFGARDSGWLEVLNSAVVESARPASEPRLYVAGLRMPSVVAPGSNVTMRANAAGVGTVAYQWFQNGTAVAGATNESYAVTAVAGATNRYSVSASAGGGPGIGGQMKLPNSVNGLTIFEGRAYLAMGAAGVEIWDLKNIAFPKKLGSFDTPGDARDVGVAKVGGVVYAFVADGASGVSAWDVTNLAGPISRMNRDDGTAQWVAMQGEFAMVADPSGLQTYQIRTVPVITQHPVTALTRNWGQAAEFRVTAEGTPPLSYRWKKNGINIPDATGPVLTLTDIQPGEAGWYQVEVSNNFTTAEADKALSTSAGLTVRAFPRLEIPTAGVTRPTVPTVPIKRAFLYQVSGGSGELEDIGSLEPNGDSEALGLNDLGQVVGYSMKRIQNRDQKRATLTISGEVFDLNDTLPEETGWVLEEARGINSRGEVIGIGQFQGKRRSFLLVPASVIGKKVVRPLGAIAGQQPTAEILQGNAQNEPATSFYQWSEATGKFYAVRPGIAKMTWAVSTNPQDTNRVFSVVANVWPRTYTKNIAGAPTEIEPRGVGFGYSYQTLHFPVGGAGVTLDTSAKIFNASVVAPPAGSGVTNEVLRNQAFTVLQYLKTDGADADPKLHAPHFEVLRTYRYDDPRVRVPDVPWEVARTVTYTNHTDYPGKNGYILFEKAFYDGAGPDRAYDRPTRSGPIIPVNALTGGSVKVDPLLVVWYQMNGIGVAWPGEPRQYELLWPVGGKKIIIASLLGSGPLPGNRYADKRVYFQPDQSLPGFNLNEEHSLIVDGKIFALRHDLNVEHLSEPFALLKYRNAQTREWGMEAYEVVAEEAPYFFSYDGEAGKEIQAPLPLSVLPLCSDSAAMTGPGWEDYNGKIYARAAGPQGTDTNIVVRYFYPVQSGFYLPATAGGAAVPEGTCIPWLDRYAQTKYGDQPGLPVAVNFRIHWPNAPTLEIGSTLTRPRVGLPDIFSMAKAQIIHDDLDPSLSGRKGLAKLFDPLSPRTYKLTGQERVPDRIVRQNINGKELFPDLPFVLKVRVSYDPINRWLSFSGHLDEAFGVGEPLMLPNVLSERERDRMKLLAPGDDKWSQIVEKLYDLTRNPNQIDIDPQDGIPDKGLRLGLAKDAKGQVVMEEFGALPKALTAGLGGVPPAATMPGNAMMFDGQKSYVNVGNLELFSRSFTVEFWGKRETLSTGLARVIVGQAGNPDRNQERNLMIGFDGGDRFLFTFGGTSNQFRLITPSGYTDMGWHHWACTYDAGSGVQRIFLDGQQQASLTNLARPYLGVGPLYLGAAFVAGGGAANFFNGQIEEFRVWPGVAKSGAALAAASSKRLLGSESGLSVYYRFDDPRKPVVNNALVQNATDNNGQMVGNPSVVPSDAPTGIPPRFMTVVENNDPKLPGLPVGLKVIRVDDGPFKGDLKVLPSDNVFDERLTLRHSGDFGGEPGAVYFEWYYHPADDGGNPPDMPITNADGQIVNLNGWIRYTVDPGDGRGVNDITLGEGKESSLITLSDNYFICRFKGYAVGTKPADAWSDWVGDPTGGAETRPQLAEGWIKRVIRGLNPFDARTANFRDSEVNTFASMLIQAGQRYEGDIAFNPSADNLNSIGLIEAYETVLRRGRNLSIDGVPAVNYSPANNALLLAATKLSDLYVLLGNEAYADAQDPTIGFSTGGASDSGAQASVYGSLASSIFTFQNQLDSLLEEELVLLRGRDDTAAGTAARPIYNRLFWNFTLGDGEVAYQQSYNISDQNKDGFIDEKDARKLYPQGHGDAWGHYLTAVKAHYQLMRHPQFTWVPRTEAVLVAGAAVEVDFLDERKFARTAAQKAKTGAQIMDLTYRLNFVDDPAGQWQGYQDKNKERGWGVTECARRTAQGAYFDWLAANAILPAEDTDPTHAGIRKVDRTTVTELREIAAQRDEIQSRLDQADTGLNPLGLAKGSVPFDLDPSEVAAGKTHYEQVAVRAEKSLRNAVLVWDEVNKASELLRRNQDSVERFQGNTKDQERDYKNRLIEIFGYPYAGDIGPGKTYPSGYDGPDLYHYMYVGTTDLNGANAPPAPALKAFYSDIKGLGSKVFSADISEGAAADITEGGDLAVDYPRIEGDYAFSAPSEWGLRRAPGEIQLALSDMVQGQARLKQMIQQYDNLIQEIQVRIDDGEIDTAKVGFAEARLKVTKGRLDELSSLSKEISIMRAAASGMRAGGQALKEYGDAAAEALPKSAGLATDVTAPARGALKTAALVVGYALIGGSLAQDSKANNLENDKEAAANQAEVSLLQVDVDEEKDAAREEAGAKLREIIKLMREEAPLRLEVYNQKEVLNQGVGRFQAAVAKGLRLIEERVGFRKEASAATTQSRYQDMTFRIFRNDALQKYRAQFDLAARYAFLAATAYDYEVNLLGTDTRGGQSFLTDIIRQRSLGQVANGIPQTGRPGLADPLARLSQNFEVLKTQMGFNNPEAERSRFSLRAELFRLRGSSHDAWRDRLKNDVVDNLWDVPEFRRFCRPFASESAGKQPGLVIRFSTTVSSGLNFFGWPLGGGDSAYDASRFATKIKSLGVWFSDYDGNGLSFTPRIYLVPSGMDVLRAPSGNSLETREWRVVDQVLPVPFQLGASVIRQADYLPNLSSLGGSFAEIRRFASFRAYHDAGGFDPSQVTSDSRLIGRSVWNTEWLLIIPGATFLADPKVGLDSFINSVGDIKLYFQTYSYAGN